MSKLTNNKLVVQFSYNWELYVLVNLTAKTKKFIKKYLYIFKIKIKIIKK